MSDVPIYDGDLFSEEVILDPYDHYRAIRDLGAMVWLSATQVHAVGRYDDVRAVLADHETFVSGKGVTLNEQLNGVTRGTTIASDPPLHDHLRQVVAHRLTPRALRGERDGIEEKAEQLVAKLLSATEGGAVVVDAVTEVAQAMPMSVVPDYIGFPEDSRDCVIRWAQGSLDAFGPENERTPAALATAGELVEYTKNVVAERSALPGSLGADLLEAADRGEVTIEQCPSLMLDYFGPSVETTSGALGSAVALFAENPDQWELLREDPSLVAGAFNEVVRLETPLRGFSRVTSRATEIGGQPLAEGERVWILYASANRDERKWDDPERFDITRDNADHMGLGYGVHGCAGQGLARLEFGAVVTRLARSFPRLELAGTPNRLLNSMARTYESLPVRFATD